MFCFINIKCGRFILVKEANQGLRAVIKVITEFLHIISEILFPIPHLCDALLLLHAGSCTPPVVVVVVGGVWFGSAGLVHHGFDCRHVGCSVSD